MSVDVLWLVCYFMQHRCKPIYRKIQSIYVIQSGSSSHQMTVRKMCSFPCSWRWWCRTLWDPCQLDPCQPGLSPAPIYTVRPPRQQVTHKHTQQRKRVLVVKNYSLTDHISRLFEKKQITCSGRYCCQGLCTHGARLMLYERYFWCWGSRLDLWALADDKTKKQQEG